MAQSKVLHYASYEAPHEGDNCEYWSLTACGHDYDNVTHYEDSVTCKNCLREIKANNPPQMTPNDSLPEEMLRKIETEATVFVKGLSIEHSKAHQHAGYIAGANAWAGWKVKCDELQAQAQAMADALGLLVSRFEGAAEMADQDIDTRIIKDCKKMLQQFKDGKEVVVKPEHNVSIGEWISYCKDCGFPVDECNCIDK